MNDAVRNTTTCADSREIESDQYIKPEDVDHFKDEVLSSVKYTISKTKSGLLTKLIRRSKKNQDLDLDDWEDEDTPDSLEKCVEHWRNAGPEQRKKMFSLFEETGVFVASCQHRFILFWCDMIKSGERHVAIPF
jgi:hypothetical protein